MSAATNGLKSMLRYLLIFAVLTIAVGAEIIWFLLRIAPVPADVAPEDWEVILKVFSLGGVIAIGLFVFLVRREMKRRRRR